MIFDDEESCASGITPTSIGGLEHANDKNYMDHSLPETYFTAMENKDEDDLAAVVPDSVIHESILYGEAIMVFFSDSILVTCSDANGINKNIYLKWTVDNQLQLYRPHKDEEFIVSNQVVNKELWSIEEESGAMESSVAFGGKNGDIDACLHEGTLHKADAFLYTSMFHASASAQQWEYFEYIYKEMTLHGFQIDQNQHTRIFLMASQTGKWQFLEHAFVLIFELGEVLRISVFTGIICHTISQQDFKKTVALTNIMVHASVLVSENHGMNIFRSHKGAIKNHFEKVYKVLMKSIIIIWNWFYKDLVRERVKEHPSTWIEEWRIAWFKVHLKYQLNTQGLYACTCIRSLILGTNLQRRRVEILIHVRMVRN